MNNGTVNDNGYQMPQQVKDISLKILATLMKNNETANRGRPPIYGRVQNTKEGGVHPPLPSSKFQYRIGPGGVLSM